MPMFFVLAITAKRLKLIRWFVVGAMLCTAVIAALTYWVAIPRVSYSLVRQQLNQAEEKLGTRLNIGAIRMAGLDGVVIENFELDSPNSERAIVQIDEISAAINLIQILKGHRAISSLELNGITVWLEQSPDGQWNFGDILTRLQRGTGQNSGTKQKPSLQSSNKTSRSFLRHFGDRWPSVQINHARLRVLSNAPDTILPINELYAKQLALESHGQTARLHSTIMITETPTHPYGIMPESVDIDVTLRDQLVKSTGEVQFNPTLEVRGIPQMPHLRVGTNEIAILDDFLIQLKELSVALDVSAPQTELFNVEQLSVQTSSFSKDLASMRILDIDITGPQATVFVHENGASNFQTAHHLIRSPVASNIRRKAVHIARHIKHQANRDDSPLPSNTSRKPSLTAALPSLAGWMSDTSPQRIRITNARLIANDNRPHTTIISAHPRIELYEGNLELLHRVIQGKLLIQGGFHASANHHDIPLGTAKASFDINYRKGRIKTLTDIQSLDLSWLGQLLGPTFYERISGGKFTFNLDAERSEKTQEFTFSGYTRLEDTSISHSAISDEPIAPLNVDYEFEGIFAPDAPIPPAKLIRRSLIPNTQDPLNLDNSDFVVDLLPTDGFIALSKGNLSFNDVKLSVTPSVYGLDWPARLPQRFELNLSLPQTPIQTIIQSVPTALSGPLSALRMNGSFAWEFNVEIPLYEARNTTWTTKPELKDLEFISAPQDYNPHRLAEEFKHTIRDSFEYKDETIEFERTITLPKMTPIPAQWLVENTGQSLEEIDQQRREREWPTLPSKEEIETNQLDPELIDAPEYWLSEYATSKAAQNPWEARESENTTPFLGLPTEPNNVVNDALLFKKDHREHWDKEPYGAYVYVPLHHISPWLIRAIMTTEDTSFYTHPGFNWYALKHSLEANIKAGRYVRGGSTISMQLAKNLYLDGSKVLARKIQEATLVWLMESVADIPKERLMEIYLNIIEYGPGIFGINEAAIHYFGKTPDKLSLGEVAWLVSIVPNPKKHHIHYDKGEIPDWWFRRMQRYMRAMVSRDRATEEDYQQAIEQKPEFYKPKKDEPLLRPDPVAPIAPGTFQLFEDFFIWE